MKLTDLRESLRVTLDDNSAEQVRKEFGSVKKGIVDMLAADDISATVESSTSDEVKINTQASTESVQRVLDKNDIVANVLDPAAMQESQQWKIKVFTESGEKVFKYRGTEEQLETALFNQLGEGFQLELMEGPGLDRLKKYARGAVAGAAMAGALAASPAQAQFNPNQNPNVPGGIDVERQSDIRDVPIVGDIYKIGKGIVDPRGAKRDRAIDQANRRATQEYERQLARDAKDYARIKAQIDSGMARAEIRQRPDGNQEMVVIRMSPSGRDQVIYRKFIRAGAPMPESKQTVAESHSVQLDVRDDHEVAMAQSQLYSIAKYAIQLHNMLDNVSELEGWVQSKITLAQDYIDAVAHYLEHEMVMAQDEPMTMADVSGGELPEEEPEESATMEELGLVEAELPTPGQGMGGAPAQAHHSGIKGTINVKQLGQMLGVEDSTNLVSAINKVKQGGEGQMTMQQRLALVDAMIGMIKADPQTTMRAASMLKRVEAQESVEEDFNPAQVRVVQQPGKKAVQIGMGKQVEFGDDREAMDFADKLKKGEIKLPEATGNVGYDNMLAVMKAVDASQDAEIMLGGEPVTIEYPEARFLAGKYKAHMNAGNQEKFLQYMADPVKFDGMMKQLRDLIDKQKNFRGSVPGERQVDEAKMDPVGKEDADIDNDGDVDKSDKYLAKRRLAIKRATKESVQQEIASRLGKIFDVKDFK